MKPRSSATAAGWIALTLLLGACSASPAPLPSGSRAALSATETTPSIGGASSPTSPQPTAAVVIGASPTPTFAATPVCPNPNGGSCLGALTAGTHASSAFIIPVTYTVPAGWQNFEDLPGNLAFLPPGGDLPGVDAGTSDSIGIAASAAVDSADCAGLPEPGVGRSASAIARVLAKRPGLAVSGPTAVEIGGLRGFVLDIKLAAGWRKSACTGEPDVPLLVGVTPSDFADTILGHLKIRMYLLDRGGTTVAVEIGDVSGGSRIESYLPMVESLHFGP